MIPFFKKVASKISTIIGKISWHTRKTISLDERDLIRKMLVDNYYIILTRHGGHLSTYAIGMAHWFISKQPGYYGHALINLEDEVKTDYDFKFIEATGEGVHYSGFNQVFDEQVSSVCLLKPKGMTIEKWTAALDKARCYLGRPYDTLFELADDKSLSCVELVRNALGGDPSYADDFADFERLIYQYKNLTPQTFMECTDFEVAFEIRH